jgi:regulator of Ty1 transposition protein 103
MSYTDQKLRDKLTRLTSRQESIQTNSQWIMFHRKHVESMARVWEEEFYKAEPSSQLNFLYLVNDVMQASRKKYGKLVRPFVSSVFATI